MASASGAEVSNLQAIFASSWRVALRIGWIWNTHKVRKQAKPSKSMNGRLRGFCFLFPMHIRHKGNVDECEILRSNAELELPHCLNERCRFDVTNSSSELEKNAEQQGKDTARMGGTSMMHKSGSSSVSSTGIFETRSIQSWIALVT